MNHELPDPANIIFGTMMYSADQMREYAQLVSRKEQATAFAEQIQTVGIPSYERTTLVTSPLLPAADALEQLAELLPADVWWGDAITPSMLVDILDKYAASRQEQPVPDSKLEPKYGADYEISYVQGWNDCRDEMITAQKKEQP